MENVMYEKRMKFVVPLTLKNRRFRELMITPIKYVKEFSKKNNLFSTVVADKSSSKLLLFGWSSFLTNWTCLIKEKKLKVRR